MDPSRVATATLCACLAGGTIFLVRMLLSPPSVAPQTTLQANMASIGLELRLGDEATVTRADVEAGRLVHMLVDDGAARVRVRATHELDPPAAERRIEQDLKRIEALFGERQAPYPGELSNSLKCPERFKPSQPPELGSARTMLRLFANERLAFGGCSDDLLTYAATIATWYDPDARRLVQVTYYAPRTLDVDPGPQLLASAFVGNLP